MIYSEGSFLLRNATFPRTVLELSTIRKYNAVFCNGIKITLKHGCFQTAFVLCVQFHVQTLQKQSHMQPLHTAYGAMDEPE